MKVDTVEVYENNNGTIEIYALVSCTEVWSCAYQAPPTCWTKRRETLRRCSSPA